MLSTLRPRSWYVPLPDSDRRVAGLVSGTGPAPTAGADLLWAVSEATHEITHMDQQVRPVSSQGKAIEGKGLESDYLGGLQA